MTMRFMYVYHRSLQRPKSGNLGWSAKLGTQYIIGNVWMPHRTQEAYNLAALMQAPVRWLVHIALPQHYKPCQQVGNAQLYNQCKK